jgi:hypothetical protein
LSERSPSSRVSLRRRARPEMLLQPVLTDILLKFQVQLHQLNLNAFAQFSKNISGLCLASVENPAVTVS